MFARLGGPSAREPGSFSDRDSVRVRAGPEAQTGPIVVLVALVDEVTPVDPKKQPFFSPIGIRYSEIEHMGATLLQHSIRTDLRDFQPIGPNERDFESTGTQHAPILHGDTDPYRVQIAIIQAGQGISRM